MSVLNVASLDDPRLRDYVGLTDAALRKVGDRFIAESTQVVRRALAAGHGPVSFLVDERHADLIEELSAAHPEAPVFVGSSRALEELTGFHLHRGALASFVRPATESVSDLLVRVQGPQVPGQVPTRMRVAILDSLVDHTNVGAAFRSAAAFGVDAVLVSPTCADPLYRRAIRVSMGTVFQVPWTRMESWDEALGALHSQGFVVAGLTLGEGAIEIDELVAQEHRRLAMALGHEGYGLDHALQDRLDRRVIIPMDLGVDSLNVAASAAVAFFATR